MSQFTELLSAVHAGDPQAAAQLLPLVYDELRRLAARRLAQEKSGQTLDATALVHEAYLKLAGGEDPPRWNDRVHFFSAAAEAMRRILIDNARRKNSEKHGGEQQRIAWHDNLESPVGRTDDLLAIDDAIECLAQHDPQAAQLVKLRFFAGLSLEDAADALDISRATAYRDWNYAKAWLRTKLA